MSSVNEWIVREYFELLGFLVSQPRKYVVPGRQKTAEEEIDLVVFNPVATDQSIPDKLIWTTDDLQGITRAVVGIRGWHTERFYASTFEQAPDILRFVDEDCLRVAAEMLGRGRIATVLCLPRLPASGSLKDQTIEFLRSKGIDGVISFRTILSALVRRIDTNKNYEKSDLLQIIRLLKNYDLLREEQLELFGQTRRRPAKRAMEPRPASPDETVENTPEPPAPSAPSPTEAD